MTSIIEDQLKKVEKADLSNFNPDTNTYLIKKRVDIKIEVGSCYMIYLKPTLFTNETLKINWNQGNMPKESYLKAEVSKSMAGMIKVIGVGYNPTTKTDNTYFWDGWLSVKDIDILQKL